MLLVRCLREALTVGEAAVYTSRDYWMLYEAAMVRFLIPDHPHDGNLALANAQSYLSRWFDAVEREMLTQPADARE